MSKAIDQRIVEMSFENHKFEKGIKESSGSLKNFSNTLKNMGTGKEFAGLENSVGSVASSFSMLEQIGIGALRRIGESAVNAGGHLIKSLSIDQLSAGLDKYQQKIESVQTMVSAGYGLEEVERSMDQLMWFADETSYSFSDMTDNMAKFVSAGIDLETSGKAMQGIATWAAHSGKNSQAASIAMFNLSQAIGMGYVDTLNWRSIMNQNMNTVMFKEIAIGVAEATGAIKEGQVTIQDFDTNLKDKWFTNDVLLKTLDQYGAYAEKVKEVQEEMNFDTAKQAMDYMDQHADKYGDVIKTIGNAAFKASQESKSFMDSINATMDAVSTGWMKTYEIIFGTLYEAKANFSALTEILWTVFAASAETRNEMLQLVKNAGGIKSVFQTLKNVSVAFLTPLRAISQAFDQFFPPKTESQWLNIINIIESATRGLIMSEETANKIQRTFAGFFAVLDIGWQTVKLLGSALWEIAGVFLPLGDGLLDVTANIGDFLVGLNNMIKQSGVFQYGLLGIKVAALILKQALGDIIGTAGQFIYTLLTVEKPLEYLGAAINRTFSGVLNVLKNIVSWTSGKFTSVMKSAYDLLGKKLDIDSDGALGGILTMLKDFIGFLVGEASEGLKNFSGILDGLDFSRIATFVTGGVLLLFINQLTSLTKSMTGVVNTTNTFVTKFSKKMFGTTTKIKDLAYVFGVLSASLFVLSRIEWKDLARGLTGMAGALVLFVAAYAGIQAITVASSKKLGGVETAKTAFSLVTLAGSVAIMALAINKISKISDQSTVWRAVGVMTAMMGVLTAYQAMSVLISLIPGQRAAALKFSGMTAGVLGLVAVIAVVSLIPTSMIQKGLSTLVTAVALIAAIQALFSVTARISGGHKMATSMLGVTGGLLALIVVMKLLSVMKISDLTEHIQSIFLLGGILAAIQLMFNIAGRVGGGVKFKTNILSMQLGLLAMVALIAILGTFKDQTKIQNGIKTITQMAGIIAGLEILTAVAARIGGGNKLQRILGAVTITMVSFVVLIAMLSKIKQPTIDKGILTITKMLGIIVAFELLSAVAGSMSTVSSLGSMLGMATALLAVAASLALLTMIDQKDLRQAAISFGIAVVTLGIMAVGISTLTTSLSTISTGLGGIHSVIKVLLPGLVALGIIVLATREFLKIMESVEVIEGDGIGQFILGMVSLTALVAAFTILTKIPGIQSGWVGITALIPGFAAMTAVVLATEELFKIMNKVMSEPMDWNSFGQFIIGIGVIGTLVAAMTLLTPGLIALGAGAWVALGGVVAAVAGLAIVVGAFAGLSVLMEKLFSTDTLINGIDKLVLVGEGIGRFFGAIVGGFSSEILIGYGEGLAGFAEALSGIDTSSFAGIGELSKALLALTGVALLDGYRRILSLATLGVFFKDPMTVFGKQIKGLITALEGVTPTDATHASDVLAALAPMAENLKKVAKAAKTIPNSGGFLGKFLGDNDMDDFAHELLWFIDTVGILDPDRDIKPAAAALAAIVDTDMLINLEKVALSAKKIPNSGGFLGAFLGDNKIDKFAEDLIGFIDALKVLDGTTDIATTSENLQLLADGVLPALEGFAGIANNLSASGGLAQLVTGNTTLTEFGREISAFTIQLKHADFTVVKPALASLSSITESFSVIGKDVMDNAAKSFKNNKEPFQKEIISILDAASKTVTSKKTAIVKDITGIFKAVLSDSKKYVKEFKQLGSDIVTGLRAGIQNETKSATKAIRNVSKSIIDTSKATFETSSPSKVFTEIGGWLSKGLASGITKNASLATDASKDMAVGVEYALRDALGIYSLSKKIEGVGEWFDKSLDSGMDKGKAALLNTAKDLGLDTSKLTVQGIKDGVLSGESSITTGITELLDLLTSTPSAPVVVAAGDTGDSIASNVTANMQAALKDSKTGLGGSGTKEIVKTELEKIQSDIEGFKYYGKMSLEEELKAYESLKLVKGQSAEDHKKIDREIYRLVKEIYEGQLAYIDAVTEAETDAAEKREDLYRDYMEKQETINADSQKKLSDLQKTYDKDRSSSQEAARKKEKEAEEKYHTDYNNILDKAEQERIRARENYASQQKSINDKLLTDINAQNKAYEDAVKSRADTIYNSYGLFSKVDEDAEVSGEELLENLRDQGAALSEWQQSLDALAARGVGTDLIEELQKMGPASKAQIKALLELTGEQLDEYVGLFKGKYIFARVKAETELEGLKASTSQIIKDLNSQTAVDLKDLEYTFADSMAEINEQMFSDLSDLKDAHQTTMATISAELTEKLDEMKATFDEKTAEINEDTATKLSELESEYEKSLSAINTETEKKLKELQATFTSTMKTVNSMSTEEFKKLITENKSKLEALNTDTKALMTKVENTHAESGTKILAAASTNMQKLNTQTNRDLDTLNRNTVSKLNSYTSDFETSGYQAAKGFSNGIQRGVYLAISAASYLATQAVNSAKKVLDEKSPSRVFEGIGKFVSLGFANGITAYADRAKEASEGMASGSIAAVSQALLNLETGIGPDIWEPVISPILDLSNVKSNALDGLLGGDIDLAFRSAKMASEISQNGSGESTNTTTIINQFDLTGLTVRHESDIDAIATKLQQKQETAARGRGNRLRPITR